MTTITCAVCNTEIASDEDTTTAQEIAEYDQGALFHFDADEWECADCTDYAQTSMARELPILRVEFA
jgi:hypothetical protein